MDFNQHHHIQQPSPIYTTSTRDPSLYNPSTYNPSPIQEEHHHQQLPPISLQQHHPSYQYHSAPEVLPEHGLEYDDTVYPVSDKYPVTDMEDYPSSHNTNYRSHHSTSQIVSNPPRIIFGMKIRSFVLVFVLFVLILVGAVVGGTVGRNHMGESEVGGGKNGSQQTPSSSSSTKSGTTISPTQSSASSSSSTATNFLTPMITPISACPDVNNTTYTPPTTTIILNNTSSTQSQSQNQTFNLHCTSTSPLLSSSAQTLASTFVYTFQDCIQLCSGLNTNSGEAGGCNVVVYDVGVQRPGSNCVVGRGTFDESSEGEGNGDESIAVAVLDG